MTNIYKLPLLLQDNLSDRVFFGLPGIEGKPVGHTPSFFLTQSRTTPSRPYTRETLQGLTLGVFAKCTEPKEK
jgi:hypothetical protein